MQFINCAFTGTAASDMEILDMNRIVKGVKIWYRGVVGPFELIQDNFGRPTRPPSLPGIT